MLTLLSAVLLSATALYIWTCVKKTLSQRSTVPVLLTEGTERPAVIVPVTREEVEPMPSELVEKILAEPQGWARDDVSMRVHELYSLTRDWGKVAAQIADEIEGSEMMAQRTLLSDDPYGAPVV